MPFSRKKKKSSSQGSVEDLLPLTPSVFFDVNCEVPYRRELALKKAFKGLTLLPNLSELIPEDSFAQVAAAWNESGLFFAYDIQVPFSKSDYPNFERSDAVEIYIDTRNLKEARISHRFCHHFLILAAANHDASALEITRFRGEDKHDLCEPESIKVDREMGASSYQMLIHLPKEILHGFDPSESSDIGFTTVIHRAGGEPQHFHLSTKEYQLMSTPMLLATLNLKPE